MTIKVVNVPIINENQMKAPKAVSSHKGILNKKMSANNLKVIKKVSFKVTNVFLRNFQKQISIINESRIYKYMNLMKIS